MFISSALRWYNKSYEYINIFQTKSKWLIFNKLKTNILYADIYQMEAAVFHLAYFFNRGIKL